MPRIVQRLTLQELLILNIGKLKYGQIPFSGARIETPFHLIMDLAGHTKIVGDQ